jgi:nucleotide-binding universal stress UspA family protein
LNGSGAHEENSHTMAQSFVKILVPLDGSPRSEHALAYAAALSQAGSTVTLLHVAEPDASNPAMLEAVVAAQTGVVPIEDAGQVSALTETTESWKSVFKGSVSSHVMFGDPKTEILRNAADIGADLIVCATHGRGVIGRWAFGSVADDLARSATIPVLVVRAKDEEIEPVVATLTRIVFPYDGSDLAASAQPLVISIATELGLPVHVIAAYDPGPIGPITGGMDASYPVGAYVEMQNELEGISKEAAASAETRLKAAGLTVTSSVLLGPAALAIEDTVVDGDIVIMTSNGRGGLERAVLGSVAEKLVRDGKAPVILVPVNRSAAVAGA